jgi:hypothetical protein
MLVLSVAPTAALAGRLAPMAMLVVAWALPLITFTLTVCRSSRVLVLVPGRMLPAASVCHPWR